MALLLGLLPLACGGCGKKPPPPAAAEEASATPPPASSPEVLQLAPMAADDASTAEALSDAAPKKWVSSGGGTSNANQLKIQACCVAMRSQAKTLGPGSPEGFQLTALAGQCDVFAKQVGPAGNAPEVGQLREMLKSLKLPGACNF